jgi:hypothetical protein
MTIRVKSGAIGGGTWLPALASGNLRYKSGKIGGGSWISPAFAQINVNRAWVDTGYAGYPLPPASLWVAAWDYTSTTMQWSAPSGGPAIAAWHIERMDVNGTPVEGYITTAGSYKFSTPSDTKHQFHVRSKGANGLYSTFTGPVKVGIGHDVSYNYGYVTRQRAWASGHISGARNKDDWFAVSIPDSVVLTGMHWRNLRTPQSSVVTPTGSRTVNWILASGDFGAVNSNTGTLYSGDNRDYGFNNNGQNAAWGIIPRGSGWSTTGNGTYQLWLDDFWCDGTESYQNYEIVSTNPAQGNYYW